jgi:formate dehydrogenase major subunit
MPQDTAAHATTTNGSAGRAGRRRRLSTPRPRLTTPMIRRNGELEPASWDEALDRVATGLGSVVDRHGPGAVGMFSCSKATNEVNYAIQKFGRTVLGTNNIDSCNRT